MKFLLTLFFSFWIFTSTAQSDTAYRNALIVHKDPRIDMLVKKQASINIATKKMYGRTGRGYRLMVMNTNKREEAIAAKTKIYTTFPELKAYLVYQAPFFRLKAGNFQTRDEAVRYQKSLNAFFPKGVFIINDVIEIKPENGDGDE